MKDMNKKEFEEWNQDTSEDVFDFRVVFAMKLKEWLKDGTLKSEKFKNFFDNYCNDGYCTDDSEQTWQFCKDNPELLQDQELYNHCEDYSEYIEIENYYFQKYGWVASF